MSLTNGLNCHVSNTLLTALAESAQALLESCDRSCVKENIGDLGTLMLQHKHRHCERQLDVSLGKTVDMGAQLHNKRITWNDHKLQMNQNWQFKYVSNNYYSKNLHYKEYEHILLKYIKLLLQPQWCCKITA